MFGLGFILGPVMGGLLGAIDLRLPFFAAGSLALLNLLYGYFVLPESLPADRRRPFSWRTALNPIAALTELSRLGGVGTLVAVVACTALSQFVLYTSWVLHNTFKFGWGPQENGWSLFAVGCMSALVQGVLLGRLLKRFSPQRLAVVGLVSSTLAYLAWGAATEGWMMYAVILCNVLGFTVAASLQSIISGAADATTQGRTMGAVSSLQSLMAVVAPVLGRAAARHRLAPAARRLAHRNAFLLLRAASSSQRWCWRWLHFSAARRARVAATTPRTT